MEIYPAIDLMNGQCVRLTGGDFNKRTVYSDDPAATARKFSGEGARWLHVVDLDGARDPKNRQYSVIRTLTESTALRVQTGGGIRTVVDVGNLLNAGAERVIIGSLSVRDTAATTDILDTYGPEKIVLALDVRGNFDTGFFATTAGWTEISNLRIEELLARYEGLARHILVTDIDRDGKLAGPNTALYQFLAHQAPSFQFQSSGGVSSLPDLAALKATGASGAIVGKALYENKFTLSAALAEAA